MRPVVTNVRRSRIAVILGHGFRPFFLAAGVWSALAVAMWIGVLQGGLNIPTRFDPMMWHAHELLFGFVLAGMAGFLLTAVPNWTGRRPVQGWRVAALAGLWLLGRIACTFSALIPPWLSIIAGLAFPAALFATTGYEIAVARNWRNLGVVAVLGVFGAADLLMHLEAADLNVPEGIGWRLGVAAPILMIAVIGGRIVPAFTRNWLTARGSRDVPAGSGTLDRIALAVLPVAMIGWAAFPDWQPVGYLLVLVGLLHLARLARWRAAATSAEPLLLILHVGYAWLALGVTLLGITLLTPAVPLAAGVHTLTAGAIATMLLAVMTRATRGHTGRALSADRATVAIYVLVTLAVLLRIAATVAGPATMSLLMASAAAWIGAFGLFTLVYGRMLLAPRVADRGK
jgi:uncharacterized protein involved in response to NO